MKNFELSEKELFNVLGGVLDEDARNWVERNKDEVIRRAGFLGGLADAALEYINGIKEEYTVAKLKEAIKNFGINVDDLD